MLFWRWLIGLACVLTDALWWLALLLALIYAASDEFHQSFVPGRHPSWVDVLGFDGGGALIALGLAYFWRGISSRFKKRMTQTGCLRHSSNLMVG